MKDLKEKPRLVFDFIRSPTKRFIDVDKGNAPRDSFLGYIQLKERGWPISYSDDRWFGLPGKLRTKIRRFIEIPSFKMIKSWGQADIVIVVTRISLILAITAKLLNKQLIFLDAMCEDIPRKYLRRLTIKLALKLSDTCICLSTKQAKYWANTLQLEKNVFSPIHYGVDPDFYKSPKTIDSIHKNRPYIISVGRDPQRDFSVLIKAIDILDWDLKLVTQSYLVPEEVKNHPRVQIFDGLTYNELFKLYSEAELAIIPIKKGTTHLSGIRATMEAMLLNVPVIASRIPWMTEYFTDGIELILFDPDNHEELAYYAKKLSEDINLRNKLTINAKSKIQQSYSISDYADSLEEILNNL